MTIAANKGKNVIYDILNEKYVTDNNFEEPSIVRVQPLEIGDYLHLDGKQVIEAEKYLIIEETGKGLYYNYEIKGYKIGG